MRNEQTRARLEQISLTVSDELALSAEEEQWIELGEETLQQFWDQWYRRPIEQYVACDFRYVARAIHHVRERKLSDGNTFCEWGCGFGIVTGLASLIGMEAIGIEAEEFLVERGRELFQKTKIPGELWIGNFLPRGAEQLADLQSDHASMFHQVPPAYEQHEMSLDDFSMIFAYPWPGEEHFLREVFRVYARQDALLLMFRGPYQIELYRRLVRSR